MRGIECIQQASGDSDYETTLYRIELNGIQLRNVYDLADMLKFIFYCGAEVDEVDLRRFSFIRPPNGFNTFIESIGLFQSVQSMVFDDWRSESSSYLAAILDNTSKSLRRIVNIPVEGFCRFTAKIQLEFLQIHAKVLRYALGHDWRCGYDSIYVFEALEKLQDLINCGAKCSHLSLIGFNNSRRLSVHTMLLQSFNVQRIDFIAETADVFSQELRWLFEWHSDGTRFSNVQQVVLELDPLPARLQDRIRVAIDLVISIFPNCRNFEIRHSYPMPIDVVAHLSTICESRLHNICMALILKLVISRANSDLLNKEMRKLSWHRWLQIFPAEWSVTIIDTKSALIERNKMSVFCQLS
uniref:Uncharacterized protein n=1 Tax=Parascaris univalens TaxID=6257 RepID=A0A915B3M0_PARUN